MKSYKQIEAILYNFKDLKAKIENDKLTLKALQIYESELSAVVYDGIKIQSNSVSNPTEQEAVKVAAAKSRVENAIEMNELIVTSIDNAMSTFNDTENAIIENIYFHKMGNAITADLLGLSRSTLYRMKKAIIHRLRAII